MEKLLTTTLNVDSYTLPDLVIKNRIISAIAERTSSYSIYREVRFAVRRDLSSFFDVLASDPRWHAHRQHSGHLFLDGDDYFVSATGGRKSDYCSCAFGIWARSTARADEIARHFKKEAGADLITDPMFSINWHFLDSKRELQNAEIEEMADDVLLNEAYPELKDGVDDFIRRYLAAPEAVIVLQGPPGTGKTRLIRRILGELSRKNDGEVSALYTGDMKALESDEIFVKFITGWDEAFVVEDADHMLRPRADGNEHLHRFLTIADGVVRSQGRKIIFSTNLPNVGDLDDALIRPGRCFARLNVRALNRLEAISFLRARNGMSEAAASTALPGQQSQFTAAELYKLNT
jgi:hypothetical protein